MRLDRHLLRLLSAALALTVAACGVDRSTVTGTVPAETEVSTAELNATLNSELARTASQALASAPVYDSLMSSYSADLVGGLLDDVTNTVQSLLLQCQPLPYASSVKTVGPAGAILVAGPHSLVIPPGALSQNTVITMEAPVAPRSQATFKPHGLKFSGWSKPILTLSYKHCSGLGMLLPKKVVYTDDLLNILESLLSLDVPRNKSVSARLDHFSSYVVAY